ncbi:MAG: hypothetical protein GXP06_13905 [Alphaproteobacteria bacterium]|nr:hypothetical protein [Alphaproteobacteria bacterium]
MKLTEDRKQIFLTELERHGVVTWAARAASPGSQHGAMKTFRDERDRNPGFADAWDEVQEIARGAVERELHRRAVEGWNEPVFYQGEQVGEVRKYSDRLLELMARGLIPERYRENFKLDASVRHEDSAIDRAVRQLAAQLRGQMRRELDDEERD